MCIFSFPVTRVHKTRLMQFRILDSFANRPFMLTTYSNHVDMDNTKYKQNAMILPVPCHMNEFIALDSNNNWAERFHTTVTQAFDELRRKSHFSFGSSNSTGALMSPGQQPALEVFQAGSYRYSIATDLQELGRYDKSKFELSPGVLDELKTHYSKEQAIGQSSQSRQSGQAMCFLILQFEAMNAAATIRLCTCTPTTKWWNR